MPSMKAKGKPLMSATLGPKVDPYGPDAMTWYEGILASEDTGGGGGGGGGGGFAAPAPPPPPRLDQDPAWLEFNRQTDLAIGALQAEQARRAGIIGADRDRQISELKPWGEQAREGISGGHESRGLFGSGAMERDIARQRADEARREAAFRAGAANQMSDVEAEIAMQIMEQQRAREMMRAEMLSKGYVA